MKVVLIQPKVITGSAWEALNLGYLKRYAEKNGIEADWEFYSGFFDSDKEIVDACNNADFVGFSCTTPQMVHARQIIEKICYSDGHPQIVMGGVHPSAQPNHTLKIADYAIKGEGELSFLRILQGKESPGIVFSKPIEPLDNIPPPDRAFIKQERNIAVTEKNDHERIGSIFSSRGCSFSCVFCSSHEVWGRKVRLHSPERVFCEMRELKNKLDIDFIKFSDDTFTINEKRIWELCNMIERDFQWGCNIRANTSENLLRKMKNSGCREVWIGAESGSPKILKDMKKGITVEQIERIFKVTKDLDLYRRVYFMLGMPNETEEDIELTRELARKIDADQYGFSMYCPFPNNSIFKGEMLETLDWSRADEHRNPWTRTNTISHERLLELQQGLIEEFSGKLCFREREFVKEKVGV